MDLSELKLLIFDLDGVLIDSKDYWASILHDTLKKFGYEISYEDVKRRLGPRAEEVLVDISGPNAPIREMLSCAEDLCKKDEYLSKIKFFSSVRDVIKSLRTRYKLAMITNSPYEMAEYVLKKMDILRFFDEVVDLFSTRRSKADAIKIISEVMKIPMDSVAYVGDMVRDVEEARKAGCRSIAVVGWSSYDELKKSGPDLLIRNLQELLSS